MSKAESIKENQIKSGKDMTRFRLTDDGFCPMMQIIKSFNNRSAMITFSMWDDFSFEGYIKDPKSMEEAQTLELTIDPNDPLFSNFSRLLGNDEEIVVDDEHTAEHNIKTMRIARGPCGIVIVFNNNDEAPQIKEKFNVFIKNIMEDPRSKLTCKYSDLKGRLVNFFNEVREEFLGKEEPER